MSFSVFPLSRVNFRATLSSSFSFVLRSFFIGRSFLNFVPLFVGCHWFGCSVRWFVLHRPFVPQISSAVRWLSLVRLLVICLLVRSSSDVRSSTPIGRSLVIPSSGGYLFRPDPVLHKFLATSLILFFLFFVLFSFFLFLDLNLTQKST